MKDEGDKVNGWIYRSEQHNFHISSPLAALPVPCQICCGVPFVHHPPSRSAAPLLRFLFPLFCRPLPAPLCTPPHAAPPPLAPVPRLPESSGTLSRFRSHRHSAVPSSDKIHSRLTSLYFSHDSVFRIQDSGHTQSIGIFLFPKRYRTNVHHIQSISHPVSCITPLPLMLPQINLHPVSVAHTKAVNSIVEGKQSEALRLQFLS
jgi:hypothetical protein